jgi:hypothetical protein
MEIADSSPECGGTYNLRARKRKHFENDSDSSPIQCGQRNTKSSSERHFTQFEHFLHDICKVYPLDD